MLIVFVYISRRLIVFVYISLLGKTNVIALKNIITALVDSVCLYRPSCLFIYAYFPWDHLGESDHLGPGLRSTQYSSLNGPDIACFQLGLPSLLASALAFKNNGCTQFAISLYQVPL